MRNAPSDLVDYLFFRHPELVLHVNRACRDEGVDSRTLSGAERAPCGVDVGASRSRQRRDHGSRDLLGYGPDRLEISGRRGREARLDDVDLHLRELECDPQLLVPVQIDARSLFPVPQGRIENPYEWSFGHDLTLLASCTLYRDTVSSGREKGEKKRIKKGPEPLL